MSFSDPIGDMLTRIRNAQAVGHPTVSIPLSRLKTEIAKVLEREGYIRNYSIEKNQLIVELKYAGTLKLPVIRMLKRVSKPSLRIFRGIFDLKPVANGLGNAVLSTSKGVLSDLEARSQNVGGEVLFYVA